MQVSSPETEATANRSDVRSAGDGIGIMGLSN